MTIIKHVGGITFTGADVQRYAWMMLRSRICLHLHVPSFNRTRLLAQCRRSGFTGRTLKQARVWVDSGCDLCGLRRDAGIPSHAARYIPCT